MKVKAPHDKYNQTSYTMASGAVYFSIAIPVALSASIASIVLVFVIKQELKELGIILIVLGVIIVIATSTYVLLALCWY